MSSKVLDQGVSPLLPEGQLRHKTSVSLGTTHFTLAPSLASSERKPKSLRDVRSLYNRRPATPETPASSTSADEADSPSTESDVSSDVQQQRVFEAVPQVNDKAFDALLPIMARLPVSPSSSSSASADGSAAESSDAHLEYFRPQQGMHIDGTLPFAASQQGLTYTRSHLPRISADEKHLWTALHNLRPLTTDYAGDFGSPAAVQPATAPHPISATSDAAQCPFTQSSSKSKKTSLDLIRAVFNWSALTLPNSARGSWYGVIFRSRRRPGSKSTNLYTADKLSHEEAVAHGGLLMYWYGNPDTVTGMNLATCIWTDRESARSASRLVMHREAVRHAALAYESFELSRYRVVKRVGETGLRIEEWVE